MPFPPLTPLEINDFSGGITDNYLQTDPRRSRVLNNLLIQPDKSIIMRPGFDLLSGDNFALPGNSGYNQKTNGLYFLMSEKLLFALESRRLFMMNPGLPSSTWVEMLGLNSKEAIHGGDEHSQVNAAEFQRHCYFTSDGVDGQGVMPSKIYQDTSNTWRAKTAGLPRAYVQGTYTSASLLAKCIANANALRTAMILHFGDAVNSSYSSFTTQQSNINLHINPDRYSLSYLTAITFSNNAFTGDPEVPSPLPTPAPAATSEATLLTLVGALNLAYSHHVAEGSSGSLNPFGGTLLSTAPYYLSGTTGNLSPNSTAFYHMRMTVNASTGSTKPQGGPYATLTSAAVPTTVAQAAAMLDDLLTKWNWHRKAVWTHSPTNDPQQFDKYNPQCTAIGTITTGNSAPAVTPDYSDVINYANNLKTIFNGHANNISALAQTPGNFGHTRASHPTYSLDLTVRLNDATDLDSCYLMIYWVRAMYYLHYKDANVASAFVGFTYSSTSGSATLSSVTKTSDSSSITAFPVSYLTTGGLSGAMTLQAFAGESQVTSASAPFSTLVMDRLATSSVVGQLGQYSSSVYHCSSLLGAFVDSASGSLGQAGDAMTNASNSIGTDAASWLLLASDLFYAMTSHMAYRNVHIPTYTNYTSIVQSVIAMTATPFFLPTVSEVSYAYFFSDSYSTGVNGLSYLVRSNPVVSSATQVAVTYPTNYTIPTESPTIYPSVVNTLTRSNVISGLPVLANDGKTNYDVSNVMLNIYRTTNGGLTYYLLAQVANGTTSYTDSTNDTLSSANGTAALNAGQTIYTTGGTVGSDQPPVSKFVHIFNNTAYFGGITDQGQYFPKQIRQSVQNSPDWVPSTFFDNLDDDLTGISSTKSNVLVFCLNSTYRMSGGFSQTGQGSITHDQIADKVGSLNSKGIIKTEIGVFFPGNDGFYYTDGYQVIKISLELNDTYLSLTASDSQKRAIHGSYDKATRRIWWAMQTSADDPDASIVYVYYLDFGVKPSGVFSTVSMYALNRSEKFPSALAFQNGVCYASTAGGKLLKSNPNSKYDFRDDGNGYFIPWEYVSVAIDLGTTSHRKYMTKAHVVGPNSGNMAIQAEAIKDLNETGIGGQQFAPINYNYNSFWGTPACVWGDASQVWKASDGKMDLWRRFPKKTLRSDFMQLKLSPLFGVVYASENGSYPSGSYATVNLTGSLGITVSLVTPSGFSQIVWMHDIIGCYIKFEFDNYVTQYLITDYDANHGNPNVSLKVLDPNNTLVELLTGGYRWEIWGYKQNQCPHISAITLLYSYTGPTNQAYPGATSNLGGGNAGENP